MQINETVNCKSHFRKEDQEKEEQERKQKSEDDKKNLTQQDTIPITVTHIF